MRIALTGGTGFLGRHLIDHFSSLGHEIISWCRCEPESAPRGLPVQWIHGELGNHDTADALVQSADVVIHDGLVRGGESFMKPTIDPIDYWQSNTTGSLALLKAAHRSDVKQFVFVSSGAVHDHVLEDRPLDETHPLRPGTLYGAYKASVETLVHHYGVSEKLWAVNIRPPSIYGIDDPISQSKWYGIVHSVCQGDDTHITGGSKSVHAVDIARSTELLLKQDKSISGQTFNCCDGMISEYEVAKIAKKLSGSQASITGSPKQAKHKINTEKIQSLGMQFGGKPLLEKTIRQMVQNV